MAEEYRKRLGQLPPWSTVKATTKPMVKVDEVHEKSPNLLDRVAPVITSGVGSMYCAKAFAVLAFIGLPSAITGQIPKHRSPSRCAR